MKNIILTILLISSNLAYSQVLTGKKITAKKFNGSTHHIGDIKKSLLTIAQYQSLAGDCWVKIDGQDIAGSDYAVLTGDNILPIGEGRFFRNSGGDAAPVGETQEDAIRNITGQFYSAWMAMNAAVGNGSFRTISAGSKSRESGNSAEGSERTGWDFDASRQVPTASENRPKNITANHFIKINNECN